MHPERPDGVARGRDEAPVTVFFRDDDVGPRSDALRAVIELLLEEGVPCNYQVVPALLDAWTADYLRRCRAGRAGLVELNQHGHRHRRGESEVWAEFGGGAPFEAQRAEIVAGRERLATLLGDDFGSAVFTPPCHAFDAATLRALASAGFRVLSAGFHPDPAAQAFYALGRALGRGWLLGRRVSCHPGAIPGSGLVEVSGAIDVHEDRDLAGRLRVKGLEALHREFARARRRSRVVGVMLHHERGGDAHGLETLRAFVRGLKADPGVRFATIEAIADALVAARDSGRRGVPGAVV